MWYLDFVDQGVPVEEYLSSGIPYYHNVPIEGVDCIYWFV